MSNENCLSGDYISFDVKGHTTMLDGKIIDNPFGSTGIGIQNPEHKLDIKQKYPKEYNDDCVVNVKYSDLVDISVLLTKIIYPKVTFCENDIEKMRNQANISIKESVDKINRIIWNYIK